MADRDIPRSSQLLKRVGEVFDEQLRNKFGDERGSIYGSMPLSLLLKKQQDCRLDQAAGEAAVVGERLKAGVCKYGFTQGFNVAIIRIKHPAYEAVDLIGSLGGQTGFARRKAVFDVQSKLQLAKDLLALGPIANPSDDRRLVKRLGKRAANWIGFESAIGQLSAAHNDSLLSSLPEELLLEYSDRLHAGFEAGATKMTKHIEDCQAGLRMAGSTQGLERLQVAAASINQTAVTALWEPEDLSFAQRLSADPKQRAEGVRLADQLDYAVRFRIQIINVSLEEGLLPFDKALKPLFNEDQRAEKAALAENLLRFRAIHEFDGDEPFGVPASELRKHPALLEEAQRIAGPLAKSLGIARSTIPPFGLSPI